MQLLATCAFGLESLVRYELQQLGYAGNVVSPGRVRFEGDWEAVCRANLWLRTADRVLILIASFASPDFDALFDTIKTIAWEEWIPVEGNFPVNGRSRKSQLTSVPAVQRTVKRAIVDRLQAAYGGELAETGARYAIEVALLDDQATLTIDTTGPSLHKRGYRQRAGAAPLKETLAAALVQLSFWSAGRPLIDPFCGSGTIPIEAAMIGRNIAPGLKREFAAEEWPCCDAEVWADARQQARQAGLGSLDERVLGTDSDSRALRFARDCAELAGVTEDVHFQERSFDQLSSKREYGCLITNPPYGERLGEQREVEAIHRSIPFVLRALPTWSHFILTAHPAFEQLIQKQADRRRKLYNGRIECTYYQFHGPKPPRSSDAAAANELPAKELPAKGTSTDELPRESITDQPDKKQPTEKQPVEQQPVEQQPVEQQPVEKQPVEKQPVEKQPVEQPPEKQPTVKQPAEKRSSEKQQPVEKQPTTVRQVFGGLDAKADEQAELFRARLRKRARHLRRWPTKRDIHCYRLYEKDIPEIPLAVDRYEDHLHITEFERPHERDLAQHADWLDLMKRAAAKELDLPLKNVFLKYKRRQRGTTQHEKQDRQQYEIEVREGGLKFIVNLSDYVDTGLFLDHRNTRAMVRDDAKDKRVLNLFAYTGSFSVYAADGAARSVTSVDWSGNYTDWAERNFELNDFRGEQYQFVQEDARIYLARMPRTEEFDLMVIDPPTFSNSKRSEYDWDVQRDYLELLTVALQHLTTGGRIYFSTNSRRFKIDPAQLPAERIHEISRQTVPEDFRNQRIHRCWLIEK